MNGLQAFRPFHAISNKVAAIAGTSTWPAASRQSFAPSEGSVASWTPSAPGFLALTRPSFQISGLLCSLLTCSGIVLERLVAGDKQKPWLAHGQSFLMNATCSYWLSTVYWQQSPKSWCCQWQGLSQFWVVGLSVSSLLLFAVKALEPSISLNINLLFFQSLWLWTLWTLACLPLEFHKLLTFEQHYLCD